MIKRSSHFFLTCLLGITTSGNAQDYKMKADLDSVTVTGFYKIPVDPALTTYAASDFSDIRIKGADKGFVPYIIRQFSSIPDAKAESYDLKVLSTKNEGKFTTIILHAHLDKQITGLALLLTNTSVERYAQISGSDNNEEWYIITEHVLIKRAESNSNGYYVQSISLPGNKYHYFKLKIFNANTDPVHLLAASALFYSPEEMATANLVYNPAPSFFQKDSSDFNTYITVYNNAPFLFDKIEMSVVRPKLYERQLSLRYLSKDKGEKYPTDWGPTITISSASNAFFDIPARKSKTFQLIIRNGDNPPIQVTGISTMLTQQYLVAWLEKGKKYMLLTADSAMTPPVYELNKFSDSIPRQIPQLTFGAFSPIQHQTIVPKGGMQTIWIWITISCAIIVLGLLTYKLIKEAGKSA